MLVLVYRKCSTCVKALKWLDANGVTYEEHPIIGFIKMTIYAEAYRSLEIKNYQIAGKKLALQLLDEYANPQAVIPWLEYFEQKNNTEPFVSFWY